MLAFNRRAAYEDAQAPRGFLDVKAVRRFAAAALALLGVLLLSGCAFRQPPNEDARLVVAQFLAARQSRNLEATMECFVANPEMRGAQAAGWTGREAVRAIMAYRLTDTYVVGDLHVSGDRVSWSEHVTRNTGAPPTPGAGRAGTTNFDQEVEALVVGGRIASLTTFIGGAKPDAQVLSTGSPTTDLLAPLCILVLVAAAVLVWPTSTADWRAPAVGSSHQLMNGLREYVARRG
jgi:hypothetical protein